MSWEWMILLSVALICSLIAICKYLDFKSRTEGQKAVRLELDGIYSSLRDVHSRVTALEDTGSQLSKLADETKKMLSEQNLAKSLRPVR